TATVAQSIDQLETYSRDASDGTKVVSLDDVQEASDRASDALDDALPDDWKESDAEADLDLVGISLDQMEAAVTAHERDRAEQARLAAYAFFEFGPELQLKALDPHLVNEIEGLVWYGAEGKDGLAQLIADDAPIADVRETRSALDDRLDEARDAV